MGTLDIPNGIAVIGMNCRLPGAGNIDEFWNNLKNGVEAITDFLDEDMIESGVSPSLFNDSSYVRKGFVIEDEDLFDAAFFGYSPREAEIMDPQQRLFLETAWKTLEHGGCSPEDFDGSIGVFAGSKISTYLLNHLSEKNLSGDISGFQRLIGNDKDYLATRVSYKLNLKGPSVSVQCACSTSLVAVHLACENLLSGACDMALAGGTALIVPQKAGYLYQEGMVLSPDGHCRAFDLDAKGMAPGNGVGAVLLKRLEDAIEDRDTIHAVIRGSAVNNDGSHKIGYTTPSIDGQAKVISEAISISEVDPESITYIETHGTGTDLGDPVEIEALNKVFKAHTDKEGYCAIGSVKTNIGHLDTVAGVASLIKTILSLKNNQIPPSLNFNEPNPKINFKGSPFFVNSKLRRWEKNKTPRRAGISSFGFGGTNAHIIIEEAPEIKIRDDGNIEHDHLLTISAKTENSLKNQVKRYRDFIAENDFPVKDICFTANRGRKHFPIRFAAAASSAEELGDELDSFIENSKSLKVRDNFIDDFKGDLSDKTAFLFTGQGSQYPDMGRKLYETQPLFRENMERCDKILKPYLGLSILPLIFNKEGDPDLINETRYSQPAIFALEYSLAELWRSWGIEPDVVMGHSVGEYAAACTAGLFSLEDGLRLMAARGRLMQSITTTGVMYSLFTDEEIVKKEIEPFLTSVSIAALNGPDFVVISGERDAVEKIVESLESKGIQTHQLIVSHAFHSPLMDEMLPDFEKELERTDFKKPEKKIVCNLTGGFADDELISGPKYWLRHILEPVKFAPGIKSLYESGYRLFVEIGPNPVLSGMGRKCLPDKNLIFLPSLIRGREDLKTILESLGKLYINGTLPDFNGLYNGKDYQKVPLPTYAFERISCWAEKDEKSPYPENEYWNSLVDGVKIKAEKGIRDFNLAAYSDDCDILNELYSGYANLAIQYLKGFENDDDRYSINEFVEKFEVEGKYYQLLDRLLEKMAENGYLKFRENLYQNFIPVSKEKVEELLNKADKSKLFSESRSIMEFIRSCGENLGMILTGEVNPMEIIFPDGSFDSVTSLYKDNGISQYFHYLMSEVINIIKSSKKHLKIIEIGAGTGSTAESILSLLSEENTEYYFTDVSNLFLERAREKFGIYPFVKYGIFDVQKSPEEQGFDLNDFDIVIAANVLHAAEDLNHAMSNLSSLLAPGGLVLIRELTKNTLMFDITFGPVLTELKDESLRNNRPCISSGKWMELLRANGFANYTFFPGPEKETQLYGVDENIIMGIYPSVVDEKNSHKEYSAVRLRSGHADKKAHPLLGTRLLSPLEDIQYETLLSTDQHPFLKDHKVFGNVVVPGTVFFEMPVAAAMESLNLSSPVLKDIVIREAIVIPDEKRERVVQLIIGRGSSDSSNFKIFSLDHGEKWRLNVQGNILLSNEKSGSPDKDLKDIKSRCSHEISVGDFYSRLSADDTLAFGAGFQGLKQVWTNKDKLESKNREIECLGRIELPKGLSSEKYRTHPVLLDACLQVSLAVMLEKKIHPEEDYLYMPTGVDSFSSISGCSDNLWCYCVMKPNRENPKRPDHYSNSFYLFDSSENIVAEIRGLHIARASRLSMERAVSRQTMLNNELYKIGWKPKDFSSILKEDRSDKENGIWLVFSENSNEAEVFRNWAESRGESCRIIYDSKTCDFKSNNESGIDPQSRIDFISLFEKLKTKEDLPLKGVFCLWGKSEEKNEGQEFKQGIINSSGKILNLIQAMDKTGVHAPISLITKNSQPFDAEYLNPASSVDLGLLRVIANEYPDLNPLMADIDENFDLRTIDDLSKILLSKENERELVLRNGKFHVPVFTRYESIIEPGEIKLENASYLVTGGCGGMGYEVVLWLIKNNAKNIIIIDNKDIGRKRKQELEKFEKNKVNISIFNKDVGDYAEVKKIFKYIENNFPPLNGVFHLAGILEESEIRKVNIESFARVLNPKVNGSWNLHSLTKDIDLDYFIMFSSISSFMANPGMAGYTCANSFLDSLAHFRKINGLPGLSINWGAFTGVGMIAGDIQGEKFREKTGIRAFEPDEALSLLERVINCKDPQLTIAEINWSDFNTHFSNKRLSGFFSKIIENEKSFVVKEEKRESDLLNKLNGIPEDGKRKLLEKYIKDRVAGVLKLDENSFSVKDDLIMLGMDSLIFLDLAQIFNKELHIKVEVGKVFENPRVEAITRLFLTYLALNDDGDEDISRSFKIVPDMENRYYPFDLTDIQQAYWIGRSKAMEMGNISCHAYFEIDVDDLDIKRYNLAWQKLIRKHDMLRMVLNPDGLQQILETTEDYIIEESDFRYIGEDELETGLKEIRTRMSSQKSDPETWPLFEIHISRMDEITSRIHIDIDMLIADVFSIGLLMQELNELYKKPETETEPPGLSFRDYVLAENRFRESDLYKKSKEYWMLRIDLLPSGPELPLAKNPASIEKPQFVRRDFRLDSKTWDRLKSIGAEFGLTPSAVLLSAYSEVLSAWSKESRFCINMTLFNRLPLHEEVNSLVGDFTSVNLLEVDLTKPLSFKEKALNIQKQLWDDLAHRYFSGVRVQRELSRLNEVLGSSSRFPVVFTSALGLGSFGSGEDSISNRVYGVSQTPQVWLDHQVFEMNGELDFNWDAVEELFPGGLLDDLFDSYCSLLLQLANEEEAWTRDDIDLVPVNQIEKRAEINSTKEKVSGEMLHTLFLKKASAQPHHRAVVQSGIILTYEELFKKANGLAFKLREKGAMPNTLVGIVMEKGWEQVVASMGILLSGAAYLPIDPEVPDERLKLLLKNADADIVLTAGSLVKALDWPENVELIIVDDFDYEKEEPINSVQTIDDLAYVIYTSGSTGLPKGVMIDHKGAVNTILDINQRFNISSKDSVLGLSDLNFDLSVYDIFGILAGGGTIIFPDSEKTRDAAHWLELVKKESVTIWNTVPALMQMFVDYSWETGDGVSGLRTVLLSGDRIPVELPDKVKKLNPETEVISLGGATEASIWSIFYPIKERYPEWKSIPYGRPLKNQQFHIFKNTFKNCPDWVVGQLYIGGTGLAKGYWKDDEKTEADFIFHPVTGDRLYRTGDLGRYLPDGNIEFLGREDYQVKLNGYRIELGEIEYAVNQYSGVEDAVVKTVDTEGGNKYLVAYIVPKDTEDPSLFEIKDCDIRFSEDAWNSMMEAGGIQSEKEVVPKTESFETFWKASKDLYYSSIAKMLTGFGFYNIENEKYTIDEILEKSKIVPRYRKWLVRAMSALVNIGLLHRDGEYFVNSGPVEVEPFDDIWAKVFGVAEDISDFIDRVQIDIMVFAVENLGDILREKIHSAEIYADEATRNVYEKLFKYCNSINKELMASLSETFKNKKHLNIVEVGGGHGGCCKAVLPALDPENTTYLFTDISGYFLENAQRHFQGYPFMEFGLLDIEKSIEAQGYEPHSFDVVIASSVVHDTRDIKVSLEQLTSLLAPGGVLVLTEETEFHLPNELGMGLQQGFDVFEDYGLRNETHPLLSREQWKEELEHFNYEDVRVFNKSGSVHDYLGFDVIVARAPFVIKTFNPENLDNFVKKILPEYMVPFIYIQLESFPKTANGKIDRKRLPAPESAGGKNKESYVAPGTETETKLAGIWKEILKIKVVGINDNFFELGGDSLVATQIMARIRKETGVEISVQNLYEAPTILLLGALVDKLKNNEGSASLIPIQMQGNESPVFCIHEAAGSLFGYRNLAPLMGRKIPIYGFTPNGFPDGIEPPSTIEEMASEYIKYLRKEQPKGPYRIMGFCMGGFIAYEMARQLEIQGESVKPLTLIDTIPFPEEFCQGEMDLLSTYLMYLSIPLGKFGLDEMYGEQVKFLGFDKDIADGSAPVSSLAEMEAMPCDERLKFIFDVGKFENYLPQETDFDQFKSMFNLLKVNIRALAAYKPLPMNGPVLYFGANLPENRPDYSEIWRSLSGKGVSIYNIPGDHFSMMERENLEILVNALKGFLD